MWEERCKCKFLSPLCIGRRIECQRHSNTELRDVVVEPAGQQESWSIDTNSRCLSVLFHVIKLPSKYISEASQTSCSYTHQYNSSNIIHAHPESSIRFNFNQRQINTQQNVQIKSSVFIPAIMYIVKIVLCVWSLLGVEQAYLVFSSLIPSRREWLYRLVVSSIVRLLE